MDNFIDSIIDWSKFDAVTNVSLRTGGVTKELIEEEVKLWQKQIELLEPLDYKKIKEEVGSWDISIPNLSNFDTISATYSLLVSYKVRISQLLADVKCWTETCDSAIKFIEDLAPGAYTGTAPDKKSNAKHIVQPFVHLKSSAYRLENYLDKMHSSILFCAQQLDLLIKEKQSRAKLNLKLSHEGEEFLANKNMQVNEEGTTFNFSAYKSNRPKT
jgi:hypothetical protein